MDRPLSLIAQLPLPVVLRSLAPVCLMGKRNRRGSRTKSSETGRKPPEKLPGTGASDPAEAIDGVEVPGPHLRVADAQPFLGGQAEHADLALVQVVVDVEGRLADL